MRPDTTDLHHQRSPEGEHVVSDGGYTLVEMLIAIILMGTVVLSIMGGMWAVVRASNQNDERAKVQAVLGAAGDGISNYRYIACPETDGGYEEFGQKAAAAVGWPLESVQITNYQYWDSERRRLGRDQLDPGNRLQPERRADDIEDAAEADDSGHRPRWRLQRNHRHRESRHSTQGDQRCHCTLSAEASRGARATPVSRCPNS